MLSRSGSSGAAPWRLRQAGDLRGGRESCTAGESRVDDLHAVEGAGSGVPSKMRAALADSPAASRTVADIELMRFTWWKKDIENVRTTAEPVGYQTPVIDLVHDLMPGITVSGSPRRSPTRIRRADRLGAVGG